MASFRLRRRLAPDLALLELRAKHAQAFAKQLGSRGEVAVLCFLAVLSGRVREPPARREHGFWNSPRESLPTLG